MKKRSNGEGSFRKLPSGNWSGQIMVGYTPEGKRRVKTFTAPTKSEVQRKIREYMDGLAEEEKAKSHISFSEWADKWYGRYEFSRLLLIFRAGSARQITYCPRRWTASPLTGASFIQYDI